MQPEDVRASFQTVGDMNIHHQERLGSTTTHRHGIAAFEFTIVSGCDQLVVGPPITMTDGPDLVWVAFVAPIINIIIIIIIIIIIKKSRQCKAERE